MDLRPWGYWMPDGTPQDGTADVVRLLEDVIRRNPLHPGALHLYIHLLEPTSEAARAVPAADRLLTLMPAAGHMVHMPGHIYQRVGRYGDAVHARVRFARTRAEDPVRQAPTPFGDLDAPCLHVLRLCTDVRLPLGRTGVVGAGTDGDRAFVLLLTCRLAE
jgi:hypothetical protein